MAAQPYIQTAARHLRDAVSDIQQQIHTIQVESYNAEHQMRSDIAAAESEKTTLKMEWAAAADQAHKGEVAARMVLLDRTISEKNQALSRQSSDAAQVVQGKNSFLSNLESVASSLESTANAAD